MNNGKLKIGEFSRLCRVTVRTLRHYDNIDLLVPQIIDRFTGYRYYSVAQLQKMQSITNLKELGYSLDEIRDLWDDESHVPSVKSLDEKIRVCESELNRLRMRRKMLKEMRDFQRKLQKANDVSIESLPAITVASYRGVFSSYDDFGRVCCEIIGPEMARLGCECPEPGYCYSVEHGGYSPNAADIEYCERVSARKTDSDIIKFKDVPEVPSAACLKVNGPYENLDRGFRDVFAWIEKRGYTVADSPRTVYVDGAWNQEDPRKWLTIIQVPVEKRR